jgi:cell division protein FtsB
MNYMSQEKPFQKKSNIKVIALVVVCIILAASLIGIIAVYLPNQAQIAEKDNTINSLKQQIAALELQLSQTPDATTYQTQIASYVTQNAYLNSQLSDLNDTLTYVYADYANLQRIIALSKSGVLYDATASQNANTSTTLWNDQLDYAGYIVVQATASSNTTYAQVLFTFGEAIFNYNQTLGTSGTAVFPVLPGIVEVRVGNTMASDANNATVKATYFY